MDNGARFSIAEHQAVVAALESVLASQLDPAVTMIAEALAEGQKILVCGAGWSMTQASQLAAQLTVRFSTDRKGYSAVSFSDAAALTAGAIDKGLAKMFSRQVEAIGCSRDVLIGLACEIPHQSLIEAIAAAKRLGIRTIGLSGRVGLNCDVDIAVPSNTPARVQEMHNLCGHLIIEAVEGRLPV